ncbi:MAG TPA: archease [Methanofastidiosum sp.]|jgi:SHS2 domain-containing protein|nr:archease [Methanofastidiosum sp.]HNU62297.1 archease [Methanofastidiosum sp.]
MNGTQFEYFDVTADIGVKVWGTNINELFENTAIAVTNLMLDPLKIGNKIVKEFFVEGNDLSSLLINWITELLIIRDSEGILFSSFEVKISSDEKSLNAKNYGDYFMGINLEMDIKAITYSLFKLEKQDEHYYLQFVLDI